MSTHISMSHVEDVRVRPTGLGSASSLGDLSIWFDESAVYLTTEQARDLISALARGIADVAPDTVSDLAAVSA